MSLTSPCFETQEERHANVNKLLALPLEDKVLYSTVKIKQFYIAMKGKVYVSFSGGKDSTVLLHLVRSVYPDVPAVFFDTGLELPEIRNFARACENVVSVKPEMSFRDVVAEYGYPCIGKNVAHWISLAQRGFPSGVERMNANDKYGYARYKFMVDAPFPVSERCCDIMKKKPAKAYHKETGRCPYIGTRLDESKVRQEVWEKEGENRDGAIPSSNPLSIWREEDIWEYIKTRNLDYSEAYRNGYTRTGCVFCMFGIMSDRDRFLLLKKVHPNMWRYCMKPLDQGGLGLREVLEYMNIPTGCEQCNLLDFYESEDGKEED